MLIFAAMYTTQIIQKFYKTCPHDLNPAPVERQTSLEISKIESHLNTETMVCHYGQNCVCFQSMQEHTWSERLQKEKKEKIQALVRISGNLKVIGALKSERGVHQRCWR